MRIGFIGLGIMGRPMAANLARAGHQLFVSDHHEDHVAELVALGATAVANGKEAAEHSELVLTMLPNSPQVRDVVLGKDGVLDGAHEGLAYVDMSSIAPAVSREVGEALAARGVSMLDAPVSGGEPGAIAGTVAFMVGGDQETFDRCHDVLAVMGSSVTLVGPLGAGNTAKLVNQSIVAVNIAVLAEALVMAQKAGVDPAAVVQAIRGGLAGSAVMEQKAGKMLGQDFTPGFRINLHIKDLNNVLDTAASTLTPMPLTAAVRQMMTSLAAQGHETDDHSALLRVYQTLAGATLGADTTSSDTTSSDTTTSVTSKENRA